MSESDIPLAQRAGKTIGKTSANFADKVRSTVAGASQKTYKIFGQATQSAGQAVEYVIDNPVLRQASAVARIDWLVNVITKIDSAKCQAQVANLRKKYPKETPSQLAHRVVIEKALYAGGIGLSTSLIPGSAIFLMPMDLAATTLLQAEMIYQIACVYGLDLDDPARKGEALTVFGLTLGGSRAIQMGLTLWKATPVAGAVIGASSHSALVYGLGFVARRFYEAKINEQELDLELLVTGKDQLL